MYDPEAIYQDADIEQRQYEDEARHLEALKAEGVCVHESAFGVSLDGTIYHPVQALLGPDEVACAAGCGKVFEDEQAWIDACYDARR